MTRCLPLARFALTGRDSGLSSYGYMCYSMLIGIRDAINISQSELHYSVGITARGGLNKCVLLQCCKEEEEEKRREIRMHACLRTGWTC